MPVRPAYRLSIALLASCASNAAAPARVPAAPGARIALSPCTLPDVKRPAKCGTARVLEDRTKPNGRTIALNVVVVPAETSPAAPDPVVYIAGGPGGIATDEVPAVLEDFRPASSTRDFVFVDQRGMGKASPLRCKLFDGADLGPIAGGALPEAKLRACLASMDADASQYTTAAAADDLDQVLGELGYGAVDLLGVSYGTYASQTLAHAHPSRVRSLALLGVATPAADFVVQFAPSSQRVLDQLFAECEADAKCHARYPSPKQAMDAAVARLRANPVTVHAQLDDRKFTATLDDKAFAMVVRSWLYGSRMRGGVLKLIHDAAEGRYDDLEGPAVETGLIYGEGFSVGAYLSIACAESLAGMTFADAERATAGTFLGTARVGPILEACRFWPKGAVPSWLHEPLTSDVPALLVNGTMDAATPHANATKVAATLPHAQAVILPGEGHVVGGPCVAGIVAAFFDKPLEKVDTACVKPVHTDFEAPVGRP